MAELWKPKDSKILKNWIDTILNEASAELNDWEIKFIDDMDERLNRGWVLSENQEKKLEQIYCDKTS